MDPAYAVFQQRHVAFRRAIQFGNQAGNFGAQLGRDVGCVHAAHDRASQEQVENHESDRLQHQKSDHHRSRHRACAVS